MCNECENNKHKEINLDNIITPFYNLKPLNRKKSLVETHPHLVEEWDYEKNDKLGIKPEYVTYGMHIKVWWLCPDCNKSYDVLISHRTRKKPIGCLYCLGRKVCLGNCLATKCPKVAKEWHPTKNETLTPFDVLPHINKKVFWLCPDCNESYDAQINSRTNMNSGCPFCAGKKVCSWNCLATLNQEVAAMWHPTLNKNLTPFNVTCGSGKKVYWLCPICNKDYYMAISNKTYKNAGCPYCSGQKVCLENCLATLRPDIAKEWDYKENNELTPFDVTCGSGKKVCWLCLNCNKNYEMRVADKVNGSECSYCSGRKVCLSNCLATLNPEIALQWHPIKNEGLTPFDVTCGSGEKVYWLCPDCNESYDAIISDRTRKDSTGCPYCAGKKVCLGNCLATLRPDLALQWHPALNKDLTPFNVTCGSSKKAFWICDKGHKWEAKINNRAGKNKTGCPECNIYYHEVLCQEIMKEIFNKEFNKYRNKTLRNKNPLELDCYNEELKINIEYDGEQHFRQVEIFHKTKQAFILQQQNDRIKDQWCINNNILQIRVSYKYDTKEEIEIYIKEQLKLNNRL